MADTNGTTVVLGWDGLDYELLGDWGLRGAFGEHHSALETFSNPIIGEPHTRELWPSMITGVMPEVHGIHAATEDEGVKWSNPAIRTAARAAQHTIPDGLRTAIGRRLRSAGAEVEKYNADYYTEQGLPTVFDRRRSLPIAVPNYRTERDDRHGFMFDRGAELSRFLDRGPEGWQPASPAQQASVEGEMSAEAGAKLGLIQSALDRDYDLVFAWFGIVDTAGHVNPVVDEPYQRRTYEQAAAWTAQVREQLDDQDTLVCVSDHGLQHGSHTQHATIASDSLEVVDLTDHVTDLRAGIEAVTPRREGGYSPPPLTDGVSGSVETGTADAVRENLEGLGYV